MTQLIRGLYNVAPQHKAGVVTIGNFDGVHQGHQALITRVKERAKALHVPSIVITFEPLPKEYFAKLENSSSLPRLTRWREKFIALAQTGIDYVLVLPFHQQFAAWRAEEFIQNVLVDHLAIEHVIIGDDFRFGFQREGDFAFLNNAGLRYGFTTEEMPSVILDGMRVSSTLIRDALEKGDQALAEHGLGRPYAMQGRVVHGDKLGRQLGFPTANINLHRNKAPVQGIYTVRVHGIEKQALPGVANIGIRPTVGGTKPLLEVYLFDFDRDIYGKHVSIEFCKKLRDEKHYKDLALLKEAIAKDVEMAKEYFKQRGELYD